MNSIRACVFRRLNNFIHDEIGLVHSRRADVNGFVCHPDMERIFVGIGINRNGRNAHLPRGLNHAARNFAPVGD